MSEPFPPYPPPAPHPAVRWRHDISNEVNALTMATAAARRMIEIGDLHAAMLNMARAEESGQRCIELLQQMPFPG
ncbi:hypothetical protein [Lysobacter sp. HA35]